MANQRFYAPGSRNRLTGLFSVLLFLWFTAGYSQAMGEFLKSRAFAKNYQIDSAYVHMQKAARLSKASPERVKAQIFLHYGKLLKLKEMTDSTFFYYQKSAEIFRKYRNEDSLLYVVTSTAELFRFRNNKEKAGYYIREAKKLLRPTTLPDIRAYYYNRRAAIEAMYFSPDVAMEMTRRVIAMQDEVTDKETVVYSYNELGAMYRFKGEMKKSEAAYATALAMAERYNLLIPKADVLTSLSWHAGTDEKIRLLEEAYTIAKKVDNKDMQFRISNLLFWPYKEKEDYKKAFEYCYIALYLEDKMYDTRALAKTAEIERKYNLSKAEQELLYKNTEVQSARKTMALAIIIFILTLIVLLIVAYFFRKTKKNNKLLAQLSQENEFLLSEAHHRINNNLQLITIMISDELRKQPDSAGSLNKILSKVESIAMLHRHLYRSENKRNVNVGEYLKEILNNFSEVFAEHSIRTSFKVENIFLSSDEAIYMGLLVTELCINTIKHAFGGQKDKKVTFDFICPEDMIIFRFADNGRSAIGQDINPKLAQRLCRQLKVNCVSNTENGFLFYFEKKLNL